MQSSLSKFCSTFLYLNSNITLKKAKYKNKEPDIQNFTPLLGNEEECSYEKMEKNASINNIFSIILSNFTLMYEENGSNKIIG